MFFCLCNIFSVIKCVLKFNTVLILVIECSIILHWLLLSHSSCFESSNQSIYVDLFHTIITVFLAKNCIFNSATAFQDKVKIVHIGLSALFRLG